MTLTHFARLVAMFGLLVAVLVSPVQATNYTWDGGGDGVNWTDPNNWDLNSGIPSTTADTAAFTTAANVTTGFPQTINKLNTGSGLVQLNGSLGFGPNDNTNQVNVGTGGLSVNGNLGGQLRNFTSVGNVTVTGSVDMFANFPTQTGGAWDISNLRLPNNNVTIGNWNFVDGANTTIELLTITTGTYNFTGTPTFSGGRPDWLFTGGGDGGLNIQLNAQTLFADVLSLGSWPGGGTRHTELHSNGGTLDLNTLNVVADSGGTGNFVDVDNGTIKIQGTSGTVWNNQSDENTQFDVRTNTNTTINPTGTGNTVSVDTGSVNSGLSGFTNNFAFHNLTLGGGDTVQLTGTAYTGGGNTALYVNGTLTGENNATLNLNTRAAFINGGLAIGNNGPGKFTVSNGDVSLTSNATATFDIAGTTAGTGYDQLVMVNGVLHLNGAALSLNLTALAPGLYTLVDNQGVSAIDGTFAGLAQGAKVNLIGVSPDYSAYISYVGNSATSSFLGGNDIMLQIFLVPEPSSLTLWGIGAVVLMMRRRRKAA